MQSLATKAVLRPDRLGVKPLPMNEKMLNCTYQSLRNPQPLSKLDRAELEREQTMLRREAEQIARHLDHLSSRLAALGASPPHA